MRIPVFPRGRVPLGEEAVQQRVLVEFEDNTANQFDTLGAVEILEGQIVTEDDGTPLEFTSGTELAVAHKLDRLPIGWIVVDTDTANTDIHRTSTAATDKFIYLQSSVTASVKLWVF